jgi:hypothetical protein
VAVAALAQLALVQHSSGGAALGKRSHSQPLSVAARTLQCTITTSRSSSRHCCSSMLRPPTGTAQTFQQVNHQDRLPQKSSSDSSWQHTLPLASLVAQAPFLTVELLGTAATAVPVLRQVVAWTIRLWDIWHLATQDHMPLLDVQATAAATARVQLLMP